MQSSKVLVNCRIVFCEDSQNILTHDYALITVLQNNELIAVSDPLCSESAISHYLAMNGWLLAEERILRMVRQFGFPKAFTEQDRLTIARKTREDMLPDTYVPAGMDDPTIAAALASSESNDLEEEMTGLPVQLIWGAKVLATA